MTPTKSPLKEVGEMGEFSKHQDRKKKKGAELEIETPEQQNDGDGVSEIVNKVEAYTNE